jgi:hypothetical protein
MDILVDTKSRKVLINLSKIADCTAVGIRNAFGIIGNNLVNRSRVLIDRPKTGRTYPVPYGFGIKTKLSYTTYRASAPGEAPAVLTGRLRKSISYEMRGKFSMEFGSKEDSSVISFGTKMKNTSLAIYAPALELGADNLKPRPFLTPAVTGEQKNNLNYCALEICKELTRL